MPWFSRASIVHVFIRKTHQRAGLGVVHGICWNDESRKWELILGSHGDLVIDGWFCLILNLPLIWNVKVPLHPMFVVWKSLSLILCWTNSRCCCDPDDLTFDLLLQASVARCASPSQASKSHFGEMNPSHACHTCKLTRWLSYPVLKESGLLLQYL